MDRTVISESDVAEQATTKAESPHDQWQRKLADAANDYEQLMVQLGLALDPILNRSSVPQEGSSLKDPNVSLDSPAVIFLQEQHERITNQNEYVRSLMARLDI